MSVIYLDNNATTKVAPEVFESMIPFFTEKYGNASSMHTFGGQVGKSIQEAREKVAAMLGALPEEIVFTSCGTESDSTAVMSALQAQPDKKHVITTRVEHSALIALGQHLEHKGYEVTYLGVDSKGRLDLDELAEAMRKDTAIVSVMFANNETGNVFPIQKVAEMVKERGIYFHTDAVQAAGKLPIDLSKMPVDFLALSGHKLHAPKGIGVLYIRKGTRFLPFLRGGHQERGRRAGTENAPYIVGLGTACELAMNHMEDENVRVPALRDKLEKGLLAAIPDAIVNGDTEHRCRIRPTSPSSMSKAKRFCFLWTSSASVPVPGPPALPAALNRPMCCVRWEFPSPSRTAPSASPCRVTLRKPKSIMFLKSCRPSLNGCVRFLRSAP